MDTVINVIIGAAFLAGFYYIARKIYKAYKKGK